MGLDLRLDSWLAWQINDAIYSWGYFIDQLIDENQMRDKKGKRLHYHNIKEILGIGDEKEEGWDLPDNISDIEEGDGPDVGPATPLLDQIFTEDDVARVDVKFDGKPTKRYMDPMKLLEFNQGGEKSEILRENIRYIEEEVPAQEPLVDFPGPTVENKHIGAIAGRKNHQAAGNDTGNNRRHRPKKTPADWNFETAEKPEVPEDWTDKKKPVGADPRGRKGKHRYRRGGNFTVDNETGEIVWHE